MTGRIEPGLLLADRYLLQHRIAVGGMGEVFQAVDRRLDRKVAVKVLRSEFTSDPEFVERFRTEAKMTASLNHPGIAAVYDYGEATTYAGGPKDAAFLVMELVAGEPLSAVLARSRRLPYDRVLDVLEQSGRALQEAHLRGLVHRDIKPGNILITPAGKVKLTDFGIAKVAHAAPVTRQGMVMGTAQYLSPEQAAGREAVPASDVYALGIVGYECLAGFRPFSGDNPVTVAMMQIRDDPPPLPAELPPAVITLLQRALIKDPTRRFSTGAAFADAVTAARRGIAPPPVARPSTGPQPRPGQPPRGTGPAQLHQSRPPAPGAPPPPPPNRRVGAATAIALVILLAAVAVVLATQLDWDVPLNIAAAGLLVPFRPRLTGIVPAPEPERDIDLTSSNRRLTRRQRFRLRSGAPKRSCQGPPRSGAAETRLPSSDDPRGQE